MKAALVLAVAGIAAAQNLSGQPSCATSCLSSAITAAGCQPTDQACQCGDKQGQIGVLVAPCLLGACSPADVAAAASVGSQLCAQYSAGATATSGSASSTGTGSGSASSTAATTSGGSSSSSGSSSGSSSAATTSTVTSTSGGGNGTVTTPKPSSTNGGSGTGGSGSGTTTSKSSTPTGGASQPIVWGAGAFLALIGAVAAL